MKRADTRLTSQMLRRQSRALARHLPGAVKGDDRAVHQARVASRRLRESVPVFSTGLKGSKGNKARRKIRRLTGALGMVRELDVALRVVDELAASGNVPRAVIDELRAHVLAERQERRELMLSRLDELDTEKLQRRLKSVSEALSSAEDHGWRELLSRRLVKRAKRLQAAVDEAGRLYAPERLHEVRIAVKKLRYGLELAAEARVKAAAPLVRSLKRVQDMLGRIQDLQIIGEHVAALQAGAGTQRVSQGAFDTIRRRIEDECRRLHGRYVTASAGLNAVVKDVRTTVVPLLAHAPRRVRPLKMTLAATAARRAGGAR